MHHTLQIDESGDFDALYHDVAVAAVLTTPANRQTLRRLDATLHRDLPFLPRPLHATDLNQPLYAAACWAIRQASSKPDNRANPFPAYLETLGWHAATDTAFKRLLRHHGDKANALLKPLNSGSPVPREALDAAWKCLQQHRDLPLQRIEAGRDAINAHLRRIIVAAQNARGPLTTICVGETRLHETYDDPDRYLALLRILFRRAGRAVATSPKSRPGDEPQRLAVYVARRHIQLRADHSPQHMSAAAIRQLLDAELRHIDGVTSGFVQVENYARDAGLPLELADWAANKSRRILGLPYRLLEVRPALHKATALQPWHGDTNRVTIAAAGGAASWLQAWLDEPECQPKMRRSSKHWAWEQARIWRDLLLEGRDM